MDESIFFKVAKIDLRTFVTKQNIVVLKCQEIANMLLLVFISQT